MKFYLTLVFVGVFVAAYGQSTFDVQANDFANRVREFFDKNADHKGVLNFNKWFEENLEDPYMVKDMNISESGTFTTYKGSFRKMTLNGLKTFQVERAEVNVGSMDFNVSARIPFAQLTGQYQLKGSLALLPFSGEGQFTMNFTNLLMMAKARLNINGNSLRVDSVDIDVIPESLDLHFEDFSTFSNSLLNALSVTMFESVKKDAIPKVRTRMESQLNEQLKTVNLTSLQPTSNSVMDDWLDRTRNILKEQKLDPYSLPDYSRNFSQNLLLVKLAGQLDLNNGTLTGLSTLMRTGPIKAIYTDSALVLEMTAGFQNLRANYDWKFNVNKTNRSGGVSANVTYISTFVRVVQPLIRGSRPSLSTFQIQRLDHIWLDVSGLGRWDNVLEIIVNLASNALKRSISQALSTPLLSVMKKELDKLPITYI